MDSADLSVTRFISSSLMSSGGLLRSSDQIREPGGWSDTRMVFRYSHLSVEHLAHQRDRLTGGQMIT